ncbi:hypothetical protein NP233_g5745 [Leucocoprinus birnbaumii]|uniref:Cytochrome P450 n=1 Tax=Leucocoprinus birnbaumii TaxID=56174 RepID=A0AAD5VUK8_9AGAR|nr:hypothetical protein NP233_g5745 [Leucocoprinus birnbaumii]
MPSHVSTAVAGILIVYMLTRLGKVSKILRSIQYHPVSFLFVGIKSGLNFLLPRRIPFINLGMNSTIDDKYTRKQTPDRFLTPPQKSGKAFGKGIDVRSFISLIPRIESTMDVADAQAIKEVARSGLFVKPMEFYEHFLFYGPNLLVSEGALWKKYRKIIGPSFSERNNHLVWNEATRLVLELMEKWGKEQTVAISDSRDITFPLTLMVFVSAGFGARSSWNDDLVSKNHVMTFQTALRVLVSGLLHKVIFPEWMSKFSRNLRDIKVAFHEIQSYMGEMIVERRHQDLQEKHDLLSDLLRAESGENSEESLSDQEILGNMFFLLVAGQDTTAHTLTCVLALLAIYQDEQDKLFHHIKTVIPDGRVPTYEDMSSLTHTQAVIFETMRLYPIIPAIARDAVKDTTMPVVGSEDETVHIQVIEGTSVILNFAALHHNPSYWEDPHEFLPERFFKSWKRDAFLPFSTGPRACLGRKFSETEAIAIITLLVSRYRVDIDDKYFEANETPLQRRTRLLRQKVMVTAGPERVSLVFHRRAV